MSTAGTQARDIVVIGASAGGVGALTELVAGLPSGFPGAIFVVLHVPGTGTSVLPRILERAGPLPARHPGSREQIRRGTIYVAPPDRHLLVEPGFVRTFRGPRENGLRPAIDPLFRSAAYVFGERVVGVVLTGSGDDGTSGLQAVKSAGGIAIVQDPEEAACPSMPKSAARHVAVDALLPLAEIPAALSRFAGGASGAEGGLPLSEDLERETQAAHLDLAYLETDDRPGTASVYSCPDCHGVLNEVDEADLLRFRCRVGHAYTADRLAAAQSRDHENSLWAALRALEENASLMRRMADRARAGNMAALEERYLERSGESAQHARVVRGIITSMSSGDADSDVEFGYSVAGRLRSSRTPECESSIVLDE